MKVIRDEALSIIEDGYISDSQKNSVLNTLNAYRQDETLDKDDIKNVDALIEKINISNHILDNKKIRKRDQELLKIVFSSIYESCQEKNQAKKLIEKIIVHVQK